jgi:hypothetical protein
MPPVVLFHEQTGQSGACLQGLGRYALRIARSPLTGRFSSAAEVRDWLWAQPIKLDTGDGEHEAGCIPAQRSRVWPKDGLNCWEATAHWLGWHLRNESPIEAHVFDTRIQGQRHVFPAARELEETTAPVPVVLQPPAGRVSRESVHALARRAAQALKVESSPEASRPEPQVIELGWAQGVLFPPPMQLLRRKEIYFWDNVDDLIREAGGDPVLARLSPVPAALWPKLPSWWPRQVKLAPTESGDAIFAVGTVTGIGTATVYIFRLPGGRWETSNTGSGFVGTSTLPPGAPPANAWYNDLLGGAHWVGDKVLRAFGVGDLSDTLATTEGDALPDWARTEAQRKKAAEQKQQEAEKQRQAAEAQHAAELQRQAAEAQQRAAEAQRQAAQLQRQQEQEAQRRAQEEIDRLAQQRLAELRRESEQLQQRT